MSTVTIDIGGRDNWDGLIVMATAPKGHFLSELTRTLVRETCRTVQRNSLELGGSQGRIFRMQIDIDFRSAHILQVVVELTTKFRAFGWDVRVS